MKRNLIRNIGNLVRQLHLHSVIHRDLYLCHLRIRKEDLTSQTESLRLPIYLMDLHRARVRRFRRLRWIVKDLGSLYFSMLQIGISTTDQLRVIREYSGRPLRKELLDQKSLWQRVRHRATRTLAFHQIQGSQPLRSG
jgi:heptose I phosphotransferase